MNRPLNATLLLLSLTLFACVSRPDGPKFDPSSQKQISGGEGRVFMLRDRVWYAAQSPQVAEPRLSIDGEMIGRLKVGGYLYRDIWPGEHLFQIGTSYAPSTRMFSIKAGETVYLSVDDKSRTGTLGALARGGSDYQPNKGEGSYWRVDQISADVAAGLLSSLALSD